MPNPEVNAAGALWVVATPIGTLGDLAPRAREVLHRVDLILAEDTRRTRRLLTHAGIPGGRRLHSLRQENEAELVPRVVGLLEQGRSAALVSDAGTPVLSDPGYLLVRAARERGLRVLSVPGPSAFTAALAASGQPPLPATLVGFLPPRAGARNEAIARLSSLPGTLVVLLSPHRLQAELLSLAEGLGGEREATLLAELSKANERALTGSLAVLGVSPEVTAPRGEYVLVVAPGASLELRGDVGPERVRAEFEQALAEGCNRSEALHSVARRLGLRRRDVYQALLENG